LQQEREQGVEVQERREEGSKEIRKVRLVHLRESYPSLLLQGQEQEGQEQEVQVQGWQVEHSREHRKDLQVH
jgi:hypothetical protein